MGNNSSSKPVDHALLDVKEATFRLLSPEAEAEVRTALQGMDPAKPLTVKTALTRMLNLHRLHMQGEQNWKKGAALASQATILLKKFASDVKHARDEIGLGSEWMKEFDALLKNPYTAKDAEQILHNKIRELLPKRRVEDNLDAVVGPIADGAPRLLPLYRPTGSCRDELEKLARSGLEADINFKRLLWKIDLRMKRRHADLLEDDANFQYALYAYSIGPNSYDENSAPLYIKLNNMLRSRNPAEFKAWKGYIYYLNAALKQREPAGEITLYRGMQLNPTMNLSDYVVGRVVHWAGYTSLTPDFDVADGFAKRVDPLAGIAHGGVLFTVLAHNARDCSSCMWYDDEHEFLLFPNDKYVVTNVTESTSDGVTRISLEQLKSSEVYA